MNDSAHLEDNAYLPIAVEKTETKSKIRETLINRIVESETKTTSSLITMGSVYGLRLLLNQFKSQVDVAQAIVNSSGITLPTAGKNRIQDIKIPRLNNLIINGLKYTDEKGDFPAEWIFPETKSDSKRVILYIHGGAYVVASRKTHRGITSRLANYSQALVLSIDYRLAPVHVFPKPLIDVLSAYNYLLQVKYTASQISFVGDSAGGGLGASAMIYCRDTGCFPIPSCIGLMSPYMDMSQSLPSWYLNEHLCYLPDGILDKKYLNEDRTNMAVHSDPEMVNSTASPLYSTSTDVRTCPIIIQVGDKERVRDDSLFFYSNSLPLDPILLEIYQDSVHVFQLFSPFDNFSRVALQRLCEFILKHCGHEESIEGERRALMVMNDIDYSAVEIPDVGGIVTDGIELLLASGRWIENNGKITKKKI